MSSQINKKKILICMPDIPFPARKNGISIRYYPIIEHASKSYDIDLLIISDTPVDENSLTMAKKWCNNVSVYQRLKKNVSLATKLLSRIKTLFPAGIPFTHLRYDETEISDFIATETAGKIYDLSLCVLLPYLNLVKKHVNYKRLTLDLIDSPYSTASRLSVKNFLDVYDTWKIKQWERAALRTVDYACYISPLDRLLGAGENYDPNKIGIIPNGLFLQDIVDEKINFSAPTIGYLGHMGYQPNIKAALRLARIFQRLQDDLPALKLVIIGRDPAPEIQALAAQKNIIVTGTVDNIWPHVNGVDIFVFPMEIGSGQQNKLLETMGAGKPVISSSLGNSGIGATSNEHLIEADTDDEIYMAIRELITDSLRQQKIGNAAQEFINTTYSWNAIYNTLDKNLLAL